MIDRKRLTVLGLNSGTSAEGLDMAVVRISRSRGGVKAKFLAGEGRRFSQRLRERIFKVADSETVAVSEIIYLDNLLGKFFGRVASGYVRRLERSGVRVDMVASHGQTVRHLPEKVRYGGQWLSGTLQLGSPEMIAVATGLVTVGDFRQAAVAVGGEGAPVTLGAMNRLFGEAKESRLIVNIGGMSNYFYFPRVGSGGGVGAADCGPGNSLSDILSERLFSERYDRGGCRAASGELSLRLLSLLLRAPFFSGKRVSTGREVFGPQMADRMIQFGRRLGLAGEDILRTAAELTANSIALKVWSLVQRDGSLSKLYLTGGGRRNKLFVSRLSDYLPDMEVCLADELGIDADFIEAVSYAVLGEACIRSEPLAGVAPRARAARVGAVLGRIVQPPVLRVRR